MKTWPRLVAGHTTLHNPQGTHRPNVMILLSYLHGVVFVKISVPLFLKTFLKMWTIFKAPTEFVTVPPLFNIFRFFDVEACRSFSSLTRGQTSTPCIGRGSLNHWAAREVPSTSFLKKKSDFYLKSQYIPRSGTLLDKQPKTSQHTLSMALKGVFMTGKI